MKIDHFLILILLLISGEALAQSNKTQVSFEYSPGFLMNYYRNNNEDNWRPVHSSFVKVKFYLNSRFDFITGLGFFNTRTRRTLFFTDSSYGTHIHHYSNFICTPVGLQYSPKADFITIEIAGAYRFSNPVINQTFQNDKIIEEVRGEPRSNGFRKFIIPVFVSAGKEIPLKKHSILVGLKGSMPLHNLSFESYKNSHYIETGILLGMKFGTESHEGPQSKLDKSRSKDPGKALNIITDTSTHFSIEYYPHRSVTLSPNNRTVASNWSHNAFIKAYFPMGERFSFTTGTGFLTSYDTKYDNSGMFGFNSITTYWTNHWSVIPAGFKYRMGRFSMNPEVGMAYNFNTSNFQTYADSTGYVHKVEEDTFPSSPHIKKIFLPLFMTLAYEKPIGKFEWLFGLKGYISLTDVSSVVAGNTVYGVGIMTGINFSL